MDKFVGVWWLSEDDARAGGAEAKGLLSLNFNGVGAQYPAIQDILKYVVDKGKSQIASKDKVGENLYNRGVYNSVLIAEAIRNAQQITGKKVVTGEDVRRGLETLNITEARWAEMGLPEFGGPVTGVSCSDHNGHQPAYMQQWDGTKWAKVSEWIVPMKERVRALLESAAKDYVSKNQPWPARTEPCDKPA
jgi:branched-chain amino acid transport system substrate-binding protein